MDTCTLRTYYLAALTKPILLLQKSSWYYLTFTRNDIKNLYFFPAIYYHASSGASIASNSRGPKPRHYFFSIWNELNKMTLCGIQWHNNRIKFFEKYSGGLKGYMGTHTQRRRWSHGPNSFPLMNVERRKGTISGNVKKIFLTHKLLLFGKYERRGAGGRDYSVHVRLQGSVFRFVDKSDTTVIIL